MIIDGTNLVMGRLATFVAKKALLGETIEIVNAEKVILTGSKENILARYAHRRDRGTPTAGPFFPRKANLILKRTIRGMLPYKQPKGSAAFKRIKCYMGVPKKFEGKKFDEVKVTDVSKLQTKRYLSLNNLSKLLGAK